MREREKREGAEVWEVKRRAASDSMHGGVRAANDNGAGHALTTAALNGSRIIHAVRTRRDVRDAKRKQWSNTGAAHGLRGKKRHWSRQTSRACVCLPPAACE